MTYEAVIKTVYGVPRTVVFDSLFKDMDVVTLEVEAEHLRQGESVVSIEEVAGGRAAD